LAQGKLNFNFERLQAKEFLHRKLGGKHIPRCSNDPFGYVIYGDFQPNILLKLRAVARLKLTANPKPDIPISVVLNECRKAFQRRV
jgi:hypothetical protein